IRKKGSASSTSAGLAVEERAIRESIPCPLAIPPGGAVGPAALPCAAGRREVPTGSWICRRGSLGIPLVGRGWTRLRRVRRGAPGARRQTDDRDEHGPEGVVRLRGV